MSLLAAASKGLRVLGGAAARSGLDMVILFVTSRCNARCETCFYHDRLNSGGDLLLGEIQALARTLPRFRDLWLSGGEPLLREDLLEVVAELVERCGVATVDLPTNGLFPEAAVEFARGFHRRLPGATLHVNVALDGLGERHDAIRAVPGNFVKTEATLQALAAARPDLPRLRLHVNTVVCAANLDQIEAVGEHVRSAHRVDGHFFQVIRGQAKDPALLDVPVEAAIRVHRYAGDVHRFYAARLFADRPGLEGWLKRSTYLGTFLAHYAAQQGVMAAGADWGYPCVAGEGAMVIEHDGTVRACELRGQLANLRDFGMDYRRLTASGVLAAEARDIAEHPCPCTHVCFIHTSLRRSPKVLALLPLRAALAGRGAAEPTPGGMG